MNRYQKLIVIFLLMVGTYIILAYNGTNVTPGTIVINKGDNKEDNIVTDSQKITIEDIKQNYVSREIINITEFKNKYVLVESKEAGLASGFDLYNLETGDRDILPTGPNYVQLDRIVDENRIIFLADGRNNLNSERGFPFYIVCSREIENTSSESDSIATYQTKYFNIIEKVEFGNKSNEVIADIRITLDGIEILFESAKGKDAEFYAGTTMIPRAKIAYNENEHQLIITFEETIIGEKINNLAIREENYYIDSIQLTEENNDSIVMIELKGSAKYYTAKTGHLSDAGLPYVEFSFKNSIDVIN